MKLRFLLTSLTLGILATVLLFTRSTPPFSLPPSAQAVVGTLQLEGSTATFSGQTTFGQNQPLRSAFGPLRLQYKSGLDIYSDGLIIREGDGNVVIGANVSPGDIAASKLSVKGTIDGDRFQDAQNSAYFIDPAATGTSLTTAGNVGIGTTGPAQKLSVAGTIESTTGGFKFPDATTQTTAASGGVPATGVMFFNAASCPSGWTELTTARGMYMVGLPLNGTLAGTSGTALTNLESRPVGQHLHSVDPASTGVSISDPGHSHSASVYGDALANAVFGKGQNGPSTAYTNSATTGISASVDIAAFNSANAGSVAGTNAPYIQLLACQKS